MDDACPACAQPEADCTCDGESWPRLSEHWEVEGEHEEGGNWYPVWSPKPHGTAQEAWERAEQVRRDHGLLCRVVRVERRLWRTTAGGG